MLREPVFNLVQFNLGKFFKEFEIDHIYFSFSKYANVSLHVFSIFFLIISPFDGQVLELFNVVHIRIVLTHFIGTDIISKDTSLKRFLGVDVGMGVNFIATF